MATAAARRYAGAVFELAEQEGGVERWGERLATLRRLFEDPQVAAAMSNPTIPTERREAAIAAATGLDREAANLARLLVESGRIADVAGIESAFQALADEAAGRVRATVTTAVELREGDRDRIARELSKRFNKDVKLSVAIDPRIIGGLRVRVGDRVIDASIAGRLHQLRRRLAMN